MKLVEQEFLIENVKATYLAVWYICSSVHSQLLYPFFTLYSSNSIFTIEHGIIPYIYNKLREDWLMRIRARGQTFRSEFSEIFVVIECFY